MTPALAQYVSIARNLASERGLTWNPPHDEKGDIEREHRWELGRLLGSPAGVWFSSFGWHPSMLKALASLGQDTSFVGPQRNYPGTAWREFYQAAIIDAVLVQKQAPHGTYRLARMAKILALAAGDVGPSEITGDHVRRAYNIALRLGDSEAARVFPGFVRSVFDNQHLASRPNLASSCTPYADAQSSEAQARVEVANARSNSKGYRKQPQILEQLNERKDEAKLPEHRAFWELCRIVFTEDPRSPHDLQLFACGRLHVITGLRAAEIALLPADWEQWREWTDVDGNPAGLRGGITRSLTIRHFAGKQGAKAKGTDKRQLVPKLQDVPQMFEDIVLHTMHEVEQVTRPMRQTYERQINCGRLFPDLSPDELVPIWEMYVRIFGNLQISSSPIPADLITRFRQGSCDEEGKTCRFHPSGLESIRLQQLAALDVVGIGAGVVAATGSLHRSVRQYFKDGRSKVSSDLFRDGHGSPFQPGRGRDWGRVHFRVGEVEEELRRRELARTLLEPALPVRGAGTISPHQFLFLTAFDKGGVRTDVNLLDQEKFYAVRRFNTHEVILALGDRANTKHLTLFARYGRTEEDRNLVLNPHAMRHLQNTELFRKGLADAIITKRFDRVSVQQSYVYDHRSLAEHLDDIDLPGDVEERLGAKASTTYRLILSGRVSGPLVENFRKIQSEEGDNAAFDFLVAEADGLHATPYGFCLNSFTVDPCPKHLECFNGCLHLARTDLPSERQALIALRERTATIVSKVEASPIGSLGRRNQLEHARKRLSNIDKVLATSAGERPFPDGADLAAPFDKVVRPTLIDRAAPALNRIQPGLDMSDA